MACVRKCRHSRLASRVHQNSPRTRLLASKPRRSCTRGAVGSFQSSRQRSHPRLAKRLCVPPAQGFGAFPCVCHRPQGRLRFSGGVLPSSGQLSPSPVSVSPSGAPCPRPVLLSLPLVVSVSLLSWPLSRFPSCSPLFALPVRLSSSPSVSAVPVRLASVQLTPSPVSCPLTCRPLVPCPVLFRLPVPLFLSPVKRRQSPPRIPLNYPGFGSHPLHAYLLSFSTSSPRLPQFG